MSAITKHRIGRYTYIYESTSFWDSKSKYPDNRKKSVGKIDPNSGDEYYKQEYINQLKQEGKPTDHMKIWWDDRKRPPSQPDTFVVDAAALAQEILGTVKNFGLSYFLQAVTENIGLTEILGKALPQCWQKILVLACYLVAEDKPTMYCSDWVEENSCPETGNMSSQRISELLSAFGYNERIAFFRLWVPACPRERIYRP